MSQETKPYRTNVHLTFPPTISGAPLVCNLTRLFDLDFGGRQRSVYVFYLWYRLILITDDFPEFYIFRGSVFPTLPFNFYINIVHVRFQ